MVVVNHHFQDSAPEEFLFDCRIIVSCFSRSPRYSSSLCDKPRPSTAYFSLLLPSGNAIPGAVLSIDAEFRMQLFGLAKPFRTL